MTDNPNAASIQILVRELIQFNEGHGGPRNARPLALLVNDPETQETLGGLYGATVYDRLKIELVYLPESLRGNGLGRRLVEQAEAAAAQRGCRGVLLETFDFQARGFYERLGYEVYGTVEDFPPGHSLFSMRKKLARDVQ